MSTVSHTQLTPLRFPRALQASGTEASDRREEADQDSEGKG
jgi:hypothetical protein